MKKLKRNYYKIQPMIRHKKQERMDKKMGRNRNKKARKATIKKARK